MDYVNGQTLTAYNYTHGPMADIEAFEVFAALASALDYAHSVGIIHRDIKPSNIMLKENGEPVLLDFGISSETRSVVHRSSCSGTIPYMSPEQLNGEPPNTAQDIYSLSATAYECLVGHPPFYEGDIVDQILHSKRPTLDCKCWFCMQVQFGIGLKTIYRPKRALQLADKEKRNRSFIRWALRRTEDMLGMSIQDDPIAISRLEFAADECLKQLGKKKNFTISLPFLQPGKHIEFAVDWDDIRGLHW